jgi:hypothetical protein
MDKTRAKIIVHSVYKVSFYKVPETLAVLVSNSLQTFDINPFTLHK